VITRYDDFRAPFAQASLHDLDEMSNLTIRVFNAFANDDAQQSCYSSACAIADLIDTVVDVTAQLA
jgi:hypothetical protein